MTINTLEDLFKGGIFCYYFNKSDKELHNKVSKFGVDSGEGININIIALWGNQVYEWWIELDPKVIEEVNREFDLSK